VSVTIAGRLVPLLAHSSMTATRADGQASVKRTWPLTCDNRGVDDGT
jgi:hypothetical protein